MIWSLSAALLASFVTLSSAHIGVKPDRARTHRHAAILSEACAARNAGLLQNTCLLNPETTEGPYSVETTEIRSNITDDPFCVETPEYCDGIPFEVRVEVVDSETCETISGAAVEIWHCSWDGIYSHFIGPSTNQGNEEDESTFLRGVQFTDDDGVATFQTVWPGWYRGRAWHIHVRVRFDIEVAEDNSGYTGGTIAHTGQMFAADDIVQELSAVAPYAYDDNNVEIITLENDMVYTAQGGDFGLLDLEAVNTALADGITGSVTLAILQDGDSDSGDSNNGRDNADESTEGESSGNNAAEEGDSGAARGAAGLSVMVVLSAVTSFFSL